MRILFLIVFCLLVSCSEKTESVKKIGEENFRNRSFKGSDYSVYLQEESKRGSLVYTLIAEKNLTATTTMNASFKPIERGLFINFSKKKGVWYDGKIVSIPSPPNIAYITLDGNITEIKSDDVISRELVSENSKKAFAKIKSQIEKARGAKKKAKREKAKRGSP